MTVATIVQRKHAIPISAGENDDILSLARKMTENKVGVVIILAPGGDIAGIVSESDLVRTMATRAGDLRSLAAKDIMTREVIACSLEDTEVHLMLWMTTHCIRHLPVVEGGKVIDMVSLRDAVKHRLIKTQLLTEELRVEPDTAKRLGIFTQHLWHMYNNKGAQH